MEDLKTAEAILVELEADKEEFNMAVHEFGGGKSYNFTECVETKR